MSAPSSDREPPPRRRPPRWPRPAGRGARALGTLALALAAVLASLIPLPVAVGIDFRFGSVAVLLALAWLGTEPGLLVALAGGAGTWIFWDQPLALLTVLAEAGFVGWHRTRARQRGRSPPPLAVSAALFWLLPGLALALLGHRFLLGTDWAAALLTAVGQVDNGILNAALADLVLAGIAFLGRRRAALPLAQPIFGVLLVAMMVPSLVITAWEHHHPARAATVLERHAAPLLDQARDQAPEPTQNQATAMHLLLPLLAVALLGLVLAQFLSRRIARPLERLAEASRALPTAIREDQPWPAPVPEPLIETDALADAITGMAHSFAASLGALREERDQREALDLALTLEETRFRTLFATMAEGVIYRDVQGTITDANPAAARLLGCTAEQVRGLAITALPWALMRPDGTPLPPDEHPALRALATGQAPGETVMGVRTAGNDRTRWLLVDARPEFRPGEPRPYRVFTTFADITRLKETEDRLRTLIEIGPHGIAEADPRTRRLRWCSGSMLRLFGYDRGPVPDLCVDDLHPPESLPLIHREFARMVEGDLRPAAELPCRRRDGSTFYCRVSPGLIRLDREATLVAYFSDVTAEREARLALERSETSLRKAQALARLGSWEHDLIEDRLTWSSQQYRIFERPAEAPEPRRSDLTQWVHPDDRAHFHRGYRDALAERTPYELVYRLRFADGHIKWVHDRGESDYAADGTPLCTRGTTQDITELHAATERREVLEETLSHYTAQLEELVDVISLPLAPPDQVRTLLWLGCHNLQMSAAVLVQVDEERGDTLLFAAREDSHIGEMPQLTRPLLVEALTHLGSPRLLGPERLPEQARAGGLGACVLMAFDSTRPDGRTDTLVLSLWGPEAPRDLDGPGQQIVRLIAQRIAAVRHQEQVQHDLMDAKGRESIGHLASGIAHDFNNLLGAIDANVYYLKQHLGERTADAADLAQVIAETQSALGQAKVITSGILSLSRAGGIPLEPVDLAATVGELEGILRQALPPAITLRVTVAPGLKAWSNGAFLQSALLNLAFNARDAMPRGGVLGIAAAPCTPEAPLAIGTTPAGDCIALIVTDTGSGIDPALVGRIFDPLFSTKARQRGHGLGLFMVAEFVNRSGAGLTVRSAPGAGTRFSLLLPGQAPEPRAAPDGAVPGTDTAAVPTSGSAVLAGLRVLVVEDDPRVREAVGRLLTQDGAVIAQAGHGQAALDRLAYDADFDLVLSDIAMPVLDGLELHRRLTREHPVLPVILMTGQKEALSALDEAADHPRVLRKPIDPAALRAAVLAATHGRPGLDEPRVGEENLAASERK